MAYSNPYPNVPTSQALQVISKNESGNQNIYNYMYNTNPSYYTAGGYYQITNSTWKQGASLAGVDTSQYPTAISAPASVQTQVATSLYNNYGFGPWQGNPKSAADMSTLNSGGSLGYVSNNGGVLASNSGDTSGQGYGSSGVTPYTGADGVTTIEVTPGSSTATPATGTTAPNTGTTSVGTTAGSLGADAGYVPPAATGGPQATGLAPGVVTSLNSWITGAETAVGTAFKNAFGGLLVSVENWVGRGFLVIIGVIILALALWRMMDPSGEKTRQVMSGAGEGAMI